jgi:hypothetical protein
MGTAGLSIKASDQARQEPRFLRHDNPLFFKPNTAILCGDAKESHARLVHTVKEA